MNTIKYFIVEEEDSGKRLDNYLSEKETEISRSYLKELIKEGKVHVNEKIVKPSKKLKAGDKIDLIYEPPKPLDVLPQNIPVEIVYEDSDLIIVNKEQGMVVHPAPGNPDGTLVNALMFHTDDLSGINGVLRPGIVHRIDKDTSGILVIAKNDKSHNSLSNQFSDHSITREYIALVDGILEKNKGTINMPIGRDPNNRLRYKAQHENSKPAITHFEVLERYKEGYTLCKFNLETGRTHQIRVHMKEIGHPLVGDTIYNSKKYKFKINGQMLHARKLGFIHPSTNEYIEFESKLPDDFKHILEILTKLE